MRSPTIPMLILLAAAWLLTAAGCSGSFSFEPDDPPQAEFVGQRTAPSDFAVAVTVYSPMEDPAAIGAAPRVLRPARYILEPDGLLRAAIGAGARESTFPPISRRLRPDQTDAVWRAVRDSGLLEEDSATRIGSGEGYEPVALQLTERRADLEAGVTTAVVYVAQNGDRSWNAVTLAGPGVDAEPLSTLATRQLVERLARLAWAP